MPKKYTVCINKLNPDYAIDFTSLNIFFRNKFFSLSFYFFAVFNDFQLLRQFAIARVYCVFWVEYSFLRKNYHLLNTKKIITLF